MSDLKRVKELVDSGEEDLAVGRACRLIRECRRAEIARWLLNYAGADSDREKVYHITKACRLGDLERIKALAATPGFDINTGYLKPMPGCGEEDIVPYTTDAEREKLNERLIEKYMRTCDATCTQLLYPLASVPITSRVHTANTVRRWQRNIYGDGINLIPSKVDPVKALFERAREAKQGGKKAGKTAGKTAHDACAACGKAGDELKMCTACKMVKYCNRDCQKTLGRCTRQNVRGERPNCSTRNSAKEAKKSLKCAEALPISRLRGIGTHTMETSTIAAKISIDVQLRLLVYFYDAHLFLPLFLSLLLSPFALPL